MKYTNQEVLEIEKAARKNKKNIPKIRRKTKNSPPLSRNSLATIRRIAESNKGTSKEGIPTWTNHTVVDLLRQIDYMRVQSRKRK